MRARIASDNFLTFLMKKFVRKKLWDSPTKMGKFTYASVRAENFRVRFLKNYIKIRRNMTKFWYKNWSIRFKINQFAVVSVTFQTSKKRNPNPPPGRKIPAWARVHVKYLWNIIGTSHVRKNESTGKINYCEIFQ